MATVTRSNTLEIIDQVSDQIINLRMVLSDQALSMGDDERLWERQAELALYEVQKVLRRAKSHVG